MNTMSQTGSAVATMQTNAPLFSLGQIVATPAVLEHLDHHGIDAQVFIERHRHGDWGNVPREDAQQNQLALRFGARILSSYEIAGKKVWVITEADRSATTLLFPSEY